MSNFDYIIVGGGTAGCILASRLSENPNANILVIEAGRKDNSPLLKIPAGETMLLGQSRFDWMFKTNPDPTIGFCRKV